jgi:nitrogen fixation protein FixH
MTAQANAVSRDSRRYRWIPWVFVGAMTLVICVNGVLVYFATREPVGTVASSPYEAGLKYNAVLNQRTRQAAQGWQVAAGYFPKSPGTGEVAVEIRDRTGKPLLGLQPHIRLSRPIEVVDPIDAVLVEEGRQGRYSTLIAVPRHGQWDVTIDIDEGTDRFTAVHRIVVP